MAFQRDFYIHFNYITKTLCCQRLLAMSRFKQTVKFPKMLDKADSRVYNGYIFKML